MNNCILFSVLLLKHISFLLLPDKLVLKKYEEISSKYNKLKGVHVIQPDYELVIDKINKGYDFIDFSLDSLFLGETSRKQINNLKNIYK